MQNNHNSPGIHDVFTSSSKKVFQELNAIERYIEAEGGDLNAVAGLRVACGHLRRVNSVSLAVRRSLRIASGVASSEAVMQNICDGLVDSGGYETVWMVLFEPGEGTRTWAQAGLGERAVVLGRKLEAGWTPRCGRHVLTPGGGCYLSETGGLCADCSFDGACREPGGIVIRLARGGQAMGMMIVTMPRGMAAGDDEVCLVREVGGDVSHALDGLNRVETETGRRESRRILMEEMPAMVCRFQPDGRLTDVNESYCRMFAMTRDELLGHNFFAFLPQEARAAVRDHFLSLTQENPMASCEHEVITSDGRRGWQEWTDRAIFSDKGVLREFQSIGRDITERRRAEEALRASEKRYRAYIDNSPVGIFIFDEEGYYVEANEAACRMVGYTREALRALNVNDLAGSERTGYRAPNFERLKQEGYIRSEIPLRHKNGGAIHGIIEAVALDEGMYMAYFIDQTEQRKLHAQLQQVQKIESVGRLAAGVAHDFNNMLSPILGYAELLLDELPTGDECYGYSLEIKNAAERSRNLVRQLLAFSRKQVLRLDPLDLRTIVSGMQPLLKQTLREDIALAIELEKTVCPVRADVGQVEQILMNLAVNAQDAMPDGGALSIVVRLAVQEAGNPRFHLELSPGQYVLLEVRDTGHGMDAATEEHAFEPFFSTKGKGGTGLGLSTVYGIVTQHGGSVLMDTRQGQGTVFSLYFPREKEAMAVVSEPKEERAVVSGHETVLVAEDNEVVRNMTVSVLTRLGYRVYNAASGEEALDVLNGHEGKVDLLLTDVVMPGMNGRQLYTRVSERYTGIRVLYMSGYSDDVIAHHGVLEEGIHFIQKPFTIEGLTTKVREVLDRP